MLKPLFVLLFVFVIFIGTKAQIPSGYYNTANGLTGAPLKTALYNIIKDHTSVSYDQLWTSFQTTDRTSTGKVWDMYSNCTFTFVTNQCGSNNGPECFCYNREHSFPKSWFGGTVAPMYTDLFHLVPTDYFVNNARSNYPFGEVSAPTYTSGNGSKVGPCSYPGYTGTVFEPVNEYKGDFARNYFYMATRYENLIGSWSACDICSGNAFPAFDTWVVNMLLKWNTQDPVSAKETARNNAVYGIQDNRNPFIDHPEWVAAIWGNGGGIYDNYSNIFNNVQVFPNPSSDLVNINNISNVTNLSISDIVGKVVYSVDNHFESIVIDIKDYAKGFYFITVSGDHNQSKTFKLIKN